MSGGEKKRKNTRSQGWEPAGAEFYQERYPMDAEEIMPQDPKYLTTLLPSKQSRGTTLRFRTNDRTARRQATIRTRDYTVQRRASGQDVQVSMLPDLSQNLSNEENIWEEVMKIKEMPIPMSQKRERKKEIMSKPNLKLQGFKDINFKGKKFLDNMILRLNAVITKLELWRSSLKQIEGNFGTGVVAYFLLLKWMFFLNMCIFGFIFFFITLPTVILKDNDSCTANVSSIVDFENDHDAFNILDLFQGTGSISKTALFYGFYPNFTLCYNVNSTTLYYNIPLAYLCITVLYFLTSLIIMVRSAARGFRERLVEGEGQLYQYCNLIFGGWDFCIHNEKSAKIKHNAIRNEIKVMLESEKFEEEKRNRSRVEKYKIIMWRVFVVLITLAIWAGCGYFIYFIFNLSTKKQKTTENIEKLFFEYLPSICIVALNLICPIVFKKLIILEQYRPIYVITFTLLRTVVLRLASLIVLYYSLYLQINCDDCSDKVDCWETYVGQQIYKLLITDFVTHVVLTFFVNFPRALIARRSENRFVKILCEQNFELPKHVLDVVYSQTLCWFGFFYAPLLSAMASIAFFLIFYIKKFACLYNSIPSVLMFRASRSNSMFMTVLLISYIFAILPIAYSIAEMKPSDTCGPFQGQMTVWDVIYNTFKSTPEWIQDCIYFLSTAGFAIPLCIILILMLYYYTAVNSANRHMVTVLKNQLVLEGRDKQFLLEKLSSFIRDNQRKERYKHYDSEAHRSVSNSN